ncbi:lipopolysaccharide biosynthesis protein [Candidatus Entotheonella palauensis]|uniref:lipopolysaccharide biosynthesis protein n=1 Tax=Candidatus Entotheonella palauensis TaxID=93172 RepID=UPI000B7E01B1|nr:oligosaccharide flippase family protein [Candidatus Entotheonella palauensis]
MASKDNTAARGTIALVLSRGGYFVLGYLAVVVLARELGPAAYGVYSVIMALLVWLEESGRYAVPSATAKLLAETSTPSDHDAFERSALALNLGIHIFFFLVLWVLAPWLARWFDIEHGALLFRLAAIDLPLFGLYTAIQAIHQGHRHFMLLGVSQVAYAFAKFAGVLSLMVIGVSLEKALVINVLSTIVGCAFLFPKIGLRCQGQWFSKVSPLVAIAVPIGLYYFPLMLRSTLLLGILRLVLPDSEEATIGILMAAVNIARVPAFALATVTVVILPSISSALARDDVALARQYLQQALRFFAILFLPACFVLVAESEALMLFIYSEAFAGGGLLLGLLVVSEGLYTIQAIFGSVLHGAGEMRKTAVMIMLALIPYLALLVGLTHISGAVGAVWAAVVTPLLGIAVFGAMIRRRFGSLMPQHRVVKLALAGGLMFGTEWLLPDLEGWWILLHGIGLVVYAVTLMVCREITWDDVHAMLPAKRVERQALT